MLQVDVREAMIDQIVDEIRERREFLEAMRAAGRGKEYEKQVGGGSGWVAGRGEVCEKQVCGVCAGGGREGQRVVRSRSKYLGGGGGRVAGMSMRSRCREGGGGAGGREGGGEVYGEGGSGGKECAEQVQGDCLPPLTSHPTSHQPSLFSPLPPTPDQLPLSLPPTPDQPPHHHGPR